MTNKGTSVMEKGFSVTDLTNSTMERGFYAADLVKSATNKGFSMTDLVKPAAEKRTFVMNKGCFMTDLVKSAMQKGFFVAPLSGLCRDALGCLPILKLGDGITYAFSKLPAGSGHRWTIRSPSMVAGPDCPAVKFSNTTKPMATYHVSMSFSQLPDTGLDEFSTQVIDGLTGNAAFTTPPVSMANLGTGRTNFVNAMAATAQGGTQATAAKTAARDTLLGLLRQEANYVQGAANN
ncbi:MAG: hypothetical protein HY300_00835, partial [Verrucomicrobia bacterium]|nr:hypothetical protein [Verrucomicrobiota bacterium]